MKRLIALTLLLMASAFPVNAHSTLVSSNPAADSTVVDFPMEVTLTFNEELLKVGQENPNKVEVFDESGVLVSGASVLSGASIAAPVGINGNGAYTVKYRVVSKDGHVVEDEYQFNVESPIAIATPISAPVEPAEDGPNLLIRIVVLAALGFGVFISFRKANSLFGSRPR
ncbi:MAG TPA: copper resistance protein CopC [Candidatus Nanopelagicaceae bacterium]|jgi:methionine-rich copper-binding protein CopC|nr:copper resistance protein CopC [Candidatus Nanopelagicaceae bacterium]